jgi:hypothetical protein
MANLNDIANILRSNNSYEFGKFGTVIMLWYKIAITQGQYTLELWLQRLGSNTLATL